MAIDVQPMFDDASDLAARTCSPHANGLEGSAILAIAQEVRTLRAAGKKIVNLTIGDFDPQLFPIPAPFASGIKRELDRGSTNYPPAVGVPELRSAIRAYYKRELGLDYPEGTVQVGAGARPPIYAAFASILAPGDVVVYPVPSWNIRYYAYLNRAEGVPLATRPEDGFMPSLDELRPHIRTARVLCLNSPLNPAGTAIRESMLRELCQAIVAENDRRSSLGERPLMLLYDQVYWQLTFEGTTHHTPVGLVPEMAPYTIFIDAVSKCWAATGMRVGWAVVPPWLRDRMRPLVGHMGAWAARPEQLATAALLADPGSLDDFYATFRSAVQQRLVRLRDGLWAMRDEGLPVDALDVEGAIYLTARFDLLGRTVAGRTLSTADDIRAVLLHEAGVAVVPFSAFGYPGETGWIRLAVSSVSLDDVDVCLGNIRRLLQA